MRQALWLSAMLTTHGSSRPTTDPPHDTAQHRCQRQEDEQRENDERNEQPAGQCNDSVNVRRHPDRRQPDDEPWHRCGGEKDEYPGARPVCDPRTGARTKDAVRGGAAETEQQENRSGNSDPDDGRQRRHSTAVSSSVVRNRGNPSVPFHCIIDARLVNCQGLAADRTVRAAGARRTRWPAPRAVQTRARGPPAPCHRRGHAADSAH